jgi:hypothetical protein
MYYGKFRLGKAVFLEQRTTISREWKILLAKELFNYL